MILYNKKNKGFTLIELMVVISIIGLLSSIVLASIKEARDKAVATKFKSEVNQFINALELYKTATGKYPYEGGVGASTFITYVNNANVETRNFTTGTVNISTLLNLNSYLKKIPTIPPNSYSSSASVYWYIANNLSGDYKYRCVGDSGIPSYVILFFQYNPFIYSLYSNLPYAEYRAHTSTGWTPLPSTSVCFSLK